MDGKIEFVMGDLSAGALGAEFWVFECTGNNTYEQVGTYFVMTKNIKDCFTVNDADRDGKLEFVVKGFTSNAKTHCFIFEATNDNTYQMIEYFELPNSMSWDYYGGYSDAGDVDGDNIPEIALEAASYVYIIKSIGNDSFYIWQTLPGNNKGSSIRIYDIDNNGLNEIIISGSNLTRIYEKGIDMEWIFPSHFDTFYSGETLNLKWRIYDTISLDSLYVYFKKSGTFERTLIYKGIYTDTTCEFVLPDTSGIFNFLLLVKGYGRRDSLPSSAFRIMKYFINENFNNQEDKMEILPLFFSNKIKIVINLHKEEFIKLNIYNHSGRFIESIFKGKIKGKNEIIFYPKGRIKEGVYFIILDLNDKKLKRKFIYLGGKDEK